MPQWTLRSRIGPGEKWSGEHDLDTQVASEAVMGCGPLRREVASVRDWESRRSWAAMKAAVLGAGEGGGWFGFGFGSEDGGPVGVVCGRVRARSSMEWLRRVWRLVSGASWIGKSGLMVYVWFGAVRSFRERVCIPFYVSLVYININIYWGVWGEGVLVYVHP